MRLLVITQAVDIHDPVLGFMHGWLIALAKRVDSLRVICLRKGEYHLPDNVAVYSLGKEEGVSRAEYIRRFYREIFRLRSEYDSVLVHMNQLYVLLAGGLWRLWGKRVVLWYAHGATPLSLRVATVFAHTVLTSTDSGFRIHTDKKTVIGQGIDVDFFSPRPGAKKETLFSMATVGRITASKDCATIIRALALLSKSNWKFDFIGTTATHADRAYLDGLRALVRELGLAERVSFVGAVPQMALPRRLHEIDLFVSAGKTGSLDKAMLEAMSSGVPLVSSNEAIASVLPSELHVYLWKSGDPQDLAKKIGDVMHLDDGPRRLLGLQFRDVVVKSHSLPRFIDRVIAEIKGV